LAECNKFLVKRLEVPRNDDEKPTLITYIDNIEQQQILQDKINRLTWKITNYEMTHPHPLRNAILETTLEFKHLFNAINARYLPILEYTNYLRTIDVFRLRDYIDIFLQEEYTKPSVGYETTAADDSDHEDFDDDDDDDGINLEDMAQVWGGNGGAIYEADWVETRIKPILSPELYMELVRCRYIIQKARTIDGIAMLRELVPKMRLYIIREKTNLENILFSVVIQTQLDIQQQMLTDTTQELLVVLQKMELEPPEPLKSFEPLEHIIINLRVHVQNAFVKYCTHTQSLLKNIYQKATSQ
jgi:hypothetical protein